MTAPAEGDTAVVIVVPEAEPVVGEWRLRLDWSAPLGVPAHVTILYPFVPRRELTGEDEARLAVVAASFKPFAADLREVRWFGDDVVYAAPEPEERFREMIAGVGAAWPEHPPYGGLHEDPTPHLTIGDHGPVELLREAADAVAARLPVTTMVSHLALLERVDGMWGQRSRFPLGQSTESQS